jgi:hypothetical protein
VVTRWGDGRAPVSQDAWTVGLAAPVHLVPSGDDAATLSMDALAAMVSGTPEAGADELLATWHVGHLDPASLPPLVITGA